jgi:hypothetical protein
MLIFRKAKRYLSTNLSEKGLGLLIVVTLILNVTWIYTDNLLGPEADSKIYFQKTSEFIDQFKISGLDNLFANLQSLSLGSRPPLYQLLSIPFISLHLLGMGLKFGGKAGDCPVTERVSDQLVRLPFYNDITEAEQASVIAAIIEFYD